MGIGVRGLLESAELGVDLRLGAKFKDVLLSFVPFPSLIVLVAFASSVFLGVPLPLGVPIKVRNINM